LSSFSFPLPKNSDDGNEGVPCNVPAAPQKPVNMLPLSLKEHKYHVKITEVKMSVCWLKANLFPGKTAFKD